MAASNRDKAALKPNTKRPNTDPTNGCKPTNRCDLKITYYNFYDNSILTKI